MGKKGESYVDCRDSYALNTVHHKFAISDGVSKSFFPGIWSALLVNNYVHAGTGLDAVIATCQQQWYEQVSEIVAKPDVKYYTRNAFNRNAPGLATFVGLQLFEQEKMWSSLALGDTFLFFIPKPFSSFKEELIVHSSKEEPVVFDNFPDYLSSIGNQHQGTQKEKVGKMTAGTFYLMTDALAEWFLKQGEDVIGIIEVWQQQVDFERYINQLRDEDKINNDDTSVLIIELTDDGNDLISYDEPVVSNLKELIAKQEKEAAVGDEEVKSMETVVSPEMIGEKETIETDHADAADGSGNAEAATTGDKTDEANKEESMDAMKLTPNAFADIHKRWNIRFKKGRP